MYKIIIIIGVVKENRREIKVKPANGDEQPVIYS